MPRHARRKIEVPTNTQSQFELGDTADDTERRSRERGERGEREERDGGEREGREMEERGGRVETETIEVTEETEEIEERGEKRPTTDTDTDPECTQSRQKKGQMKSIFLRDSDEDVS